MRKWTYSPNNNWVTVPTLKRPIHPISSSYFHLTSPILRSERNEYISPRTRKPRDQQNTHRPRPQSPTTPQVIENIQMNPTNRGTETHHFIPHHTVPLHYSSTLSYLLLNPEPPLNLPKPLILTPTAIRGGIYPLPHPDLNLERYPHSTPQPQKIWVSKLINLETGDLL